MYVVVTLAIKWPNRNHWYTPATYRNSNIYKPDFIINISLSFACSFFLNLVDNRTWIMNVSKCRSVFQLPSHQRTPLENEYYIRLLKYCLKSKSVGILLRITDECLLDKMWPVILSLYLPLDKNYSMNAHFKVD